MAKMMKEKVRKGNVGYMCFWFNPRFEQGDEEHGGIIRMEAADPGDEDHALLTSKIEDIVMTEDGYDIITQNSIYSIEAVPYFVSFIIKYLHKDKRVTSNTLIDCALNKLPTCWGWKIV